MNVRRQKLAGWIALQTAQATPAGAHEIAEMQTFNVREPASGRSYGVVKLRTRSGLTGWGEGAPEGEAAIAQQLLPVHEAGWR